MRARKTSHRNRFAGASPWAIATVLALSPLMAPSPAAAQTSGGMAPTEARAQFNIPAGPLAGALRQFADRTGVQMVYFTVLVQGLRSPGASGDLTLREALAQLLAGTSLSFHMPDPRTVTIDPAPIAGARTLGAVQVEGVQSTGLASLNGFGAGAGSNGGSDPTATEGTGSLTTNGATVASKTPQSLKDTPQSVTVITHERIEQQNLTDLTSALNYTPGVTLKDTSAIITNFYSRGFQIGTFQIDGGAPLDLGYSSLYQTTPNLAEYDNVQVLRGSDALFGGAGQPGGVVSLDRKRPLDHDQFLGEIDAGSWNNYLVQADVTGPIAFDGHLRARLVVNDQDRDFFYETAHQNKAFVYGVVEGDLGPNTITRAGFSYEQQDNKGYNSTGLPRYSDGGDLDLPRLTNFAAPGNRYNLTTPEVFAAIEHKFNADWGLKINFTRLAQNINSSNSGDAGNVYQNDPTLSNYIESNIANEKNSDIQYSIDETLNGDFEIFGLKQKLTLGSDYGITNSGINSRISIISIPIDVFSFNPSSLFYQPSTYRIHSIVPNLKQEQWGSYLTLNIQPIENLHLIGGVRLSSYWDIEDFSDYFSFSKTPFFTSITKNDYANAVTPYAAVTYGLTHDITLYASYADIFQVQGEDLDPTGKPLPPVTGVTYETGIKGAFNGGKLNTSLSVYYTDESNQAVLDPDQSQCSFGGSCYLNEGAVISQGVELEVTGQLLPGWQAQAGYTYNDNRENKAYLNDYGNGLNSTYTTQQPKHQLKLWTTYTPTGRFNQWTVGGGLRLESARYNAGSVCSVELNPVTGACSSNAYLPYAFTQPLYTVVDLRVAYKFNSHWQAALNLTNIGDTRYYSTVGYSTDGNFYGEPRAFMFSIKAAY